MTFFTILKFEIILFFGNLLKFVLPISSHVTITLLSCLHTFSVSVELKFRAEIFRRPKSAGSFTSTETEGDARWLWLGNFSITLFFAFIRTFYFSCNDTCWRICIFKRLSTYPGYQSLLHGTEWYWAPGLKWVDLVSYTFSYKKLGSCHGTKSYLIEHEISSINIVL